jgi:1-acyl-sn-glycerol-3-phosphate acyltransferase
VIWLLRRCVLAPAVIWLTVAAWVTLPVWLLVAAALAPVLPGRWRPLRLLWMLVLYLTAESVLLVVLLGFWLASGFGRRLRTAYWEGVHYDLVQGLLWVLFAEARRVLALRIETDGPAPDAYPGIPLIVASRHAGPGDSFTLVHALMDWYDREPRVVLKDTMAWDPMIDVVLRRIPARFITPAGKPGADFEGQIADLARDLDANDAFVIFPEGGNFTPARKRRGIERLHRLGLDRMASRAEQMTHVLAPRPGGLLAALDAAPEADVVLVAHTGLDHLVTVRDLWRELPMDKVLVMRWWQVSRDEIPADREARIEWLFGWWERIDAWVAENKPQELPRGRRRAPQTATP